MKFFFTILLLLAGSNSFAQKQIVDTSFFGTWSFVQPGIGISNDGQYFFYDVDNKPIGGHTLIIQSTNKNWKREFCGGGSAKFFDNGKRIVFMNAHDSLCILMLGKEETTIIPHVNKYELFYLDKEEVLAYLVDTPARQFILNGLVPDNVQRYNDVTNFSLGPDGKSILMLSEKVTDKGPYHFIEWLNIADGMRTLVWESKEVPGNCIVGPDSGQLAFRTSNPTNPRQIAGIWYYRDGMEKAALLATNTSPGIDSNLLISNDLMRFSRDGSRLFIKLIEKSLPTANPDAVKVDVWGYNDVKMQSSQLNTLKPGLFDAAIDIVGKRIIRLQQQYDIPPLKTNEDDDVRLYFNCKGDVEDYWWNPSSRLDVYIVRTKDGLRTLLRDKTSDQRFYNFNFPISPTGRWLIFYDQGQAAYFTYDLINGKSYNITGHIPVDFSVCNGSDGSLTLPAAGLRVPVRCRVGVGNWLVHDSAVLIYDEYDIWLADTKGIRAPKNVTHGYGRSHRIVFRLPEEYSPDELSKTDQILFKQDKILLRAFNTDNKYSGFYQTALQGNTDPELLTMDACNYSSTIEKARDSNVWIVSRMSDADASNYYSTPDFRSFTSVSNVHPQNGFNWLTKELITWRTFNGRVSKGILCKPENFDKKKKYPIIFYLYEKFSDQIYNFDEPDVTRSAINIPYFVSHGYLVFLPDIEYTMGSPGESAVNSVVSAAEYLSKLPYVDGHRMGVDGQSWGGYEVNYLVTHTHLFAAAAEMAGPTDFISGYGGIRFGEKRGYGITGQDMFEISQSRIGATLWDRPDLYIRNSPVFKADRVTTPLLMVNNLGDNNVPFEQGLELYTALRRLRKKVWMLQYDHAGHMIPHIRDALDYSIRLTQFFDHYLKGSLPPIWMTEGIPARLKGIETGFALDTSGKQP